MHVFDATSQEPESRVPFRPTPVSDFNSAGLRLAAIEALILKLLRVRGSATGRQIASELGLPFGLFPDYLRTLKHQQLVTYEGLVQANDYSYALTDQGRDRAQAYHAQCPYVGAAPVPLETYREAVEAQSIAGEAPEEADLRRAFSDLSLTDATIDLLGPAIHAGRGLFLFGPPGNGKSSIAERITRCFGTTIWIPRVIEAEGQLIKLYDPGQHDAIPSPGAGLLREAQHDGRWVEIRRPSIVAGGELTMDRLELHSSSSSGIHEASLQMKSNNGTLVIDDFGRQRMAPVDLLNRWIVPLERRYDFLTLASGKSICVPFDQLIIFSTNLQPRDLVDEAFLRRIPYKIPVLDPDEAHFRAMFHRAAPSLGFSTIDETAIDHLIARHYRACDRPFRYCHPRDLLLQIRHNCSYHHRPLEMNPETIDASVPNYFSDV